MSSLSLRGIICKSIPIRRPNPTRLHHPHQRVVVVASMADASEKQQPEFVEETKKKEEEAVVLPPPPEKPLPDDCCGSGCVRCVWDIYYDELEEYNNTLLLLQKSKPDSQSKS